MTDEKEYVDVSRLDVVAYTRPNGSSDYQNGFEDGVSFILDKVDNLPREKAVPVIHGHWILEREPNGKPYCFHCSVCDDDFHHIGITTGYDYCPLCGAKMDEEAE